MAGPHSRERNWMRIIDQAGESHLGATLVRLARRATAMHVGEAEPARHVAQPHPLRRNVARPSSAVRRSSQITAPAEGGRATSGKEGEQ